jgi:4-hydroxy-3-methylbut-2-enyl diphosphate reductase
VQRLTSFFRDRGVDEVEEFAVLREDVRFMLPKTIRPDRASAGGADQVT